MNDQKSVSKSILARPIEIGQRRITDIETRDYKLIGNQFPSKMTETNETQVNIMLINRKQPRKSYACFLTLWRQVQRYIHQEKFKKINVSPSLQQPIGSNVNLINNTYAKK